MFEVRYFRCKQMDRLGTCSRAVFRVGLFGYKEGVLAIRQDRRYRDSGRETQCPDLLIFIELFGGVVSVEEDPAFLIYTPIHRSCLHLSTHHFSTNIEIASFESLIEMSQFNSFSPSKSRYLEQR